MTCSLETCFKAVKLSNRGLLQLSGKDCFSYFQSLITNDLRTNSGSIYTSFLNIVGKVLMDFIVYLQSGDPSTRQLALLATKRDRFGIDGKQSDSLLLECDAKLIDPAFKTLFAHKIRKDVIIEKAFDYNVWVIYPFLNDNRYVDPSNLLNLKQIVSKDIFFVKDPRLNSIFYRFVTRLNGQNFKNISHQLTDIVGRPVIEFDLKDYQLFRFKMGIPEGLQDFKPSFYNASNSNIDIMNGLSLIKGYFVGRPTFLRSKIYNKNVSRIMPIEFNLPEGKSIDYLNNLNLSWSTVFTDPSGSVDLGTIINRKGKFGIGLIDFSKAAKYNFKLFHKQSKLTAQTWIPFWWPKSSMLQVPTQISHF